MCYIFNDWEININYSNQLRALISRGLIILDPIISQEEYDVQEALGHLYEVMCNAPLKINEEMVKFVGHPLEDIPTGGIPRLIDYYHTKKNIPRPNNPGV